jgi:hypothetical protein
MVRRQRHELSLLIAEETVGEKKECGGPLFDEVGKGCVDLTLRAGFLHDKFKPQLLRGGLRFLQIWRGIRAVWIHQHGDGLGARKERLQQFQPFRGEEIDEDGYACNIAARSRKAGDESGRNRIRAEGEHDWDRRSRCLCGKRGGCAGGREQYRNLLPDQVVASVGNRSYCPSAQRYSIVTFCPSINPSSLRPWRSAAMAAESLPCDVEPRYPIPAG